MAGNRATQAAQGSDGRKVFDLYDEVGGCDVNIDYAHHEVHSGSHYYATISDTDLDTAETNGFVIVTSNSTKWAHAVIGVNNTVSADFMVYEGSVQTNLGTEVTSFNSDRNSDNAAYTSFYRFDDTSVTNLGTQISERLLGSASPQSRSGGEGRADNELILKQNTTYSVIIVGQAENGRANISVEFYEHTNKTD